MGLDCVRLDFVSFYDVCSLVVYGCGLLVVRGCPVGCVSWFIVCGWIVEVVRSLIVLLVLLLCVVLVLLVACICGYVVGVGLVLMVVCLSVCLLCWRDCLLFL